MKEKIEILAPAGSMESLMAAAAAGADAVYTGGRMFGARAFANNLSEEELLWAIDYMHLHGRKLYLTVNTLLKEKEIEENLYDYLLPYYRQGLDAVIVQDIGVFSFIRKHFPELPIHASTQMTITGLDGARFLEKEGAERVVTARELQVDEVRKIAEETELEIESFVHGALCYCYSGQCLFSSFLGGRSGNRGQCAQPCRLKYRAEGETKDRHLLSLKDICTLELIPELIGAGIDSFKIEGRMKKPEYVAGVTAMYRKYTDLYFSLCSSCPDGTDEEAYIKNHYRVEKRDREMLLDLYNRGGFHCGYYHTKNGKAMLALERPNHAGIPAVRLTGRQGKYWCGEALTDLNPQDVLELPVPKGQERPENYTCGFKASKGSKVQLSVSAAAPLKSGMILSRTRNEALLDSLKKQYIERKIKEKINGKFILSEGESATLTVECRNLEVTVRGDRAEKARNQPMDGGRIQKQLQKTGNTEFEFEHLDVEISGSPFLPIQSLNEIRRRALEELTAALCGTYRRSAGTFIKIDFKRQFRGETMPESRGTGPDGYPVYASAETVEQVEELCRVPWISRIYVDSSMLALGREDEMLASLVHKIRQSDKECYLAMPHIFREETKQRFCSWWRELAESGIDGVLVRNYESFSFLKEREFAKPVVTDYNLYQFNCYAKAFWSEQGASHLTAPLELNMAELRELGISDSEFLVYGYLPMMVSAGCIKKTIGKCDQKQEVTKISDRLRKAFSVKNYCGYCYNIMYNYVPLYLGDKLHETAALGPFALRLGFTLEDRKETREIIRLFDAALGGDKPEFTGGEFTRGHFKRGIK